MEVSYMDEFCMSLQAGCCYLTYMCPADWSYTIISTENM